MPVHAPDEVLRVPSKAVGTRQQERGRARGRGGGGRDGAHTHHERTTSTLTILTSSQPNQTPGQRERRVGFVTGSGFVRLARMTPPATAVINYVPLPFAYYAKNDCYIGASNALPAYVGKMGEGGGGAEGARRLAPRGTVLVTTVMCTYSALRQEEQPLQPLQRLPVAARAYCKCSA